MEEHGVKIHETESLKASDGFAASAGDSLEKHGAHALDGFRPDPTDYFASLVQAADAAGLLSETDVSSLQAQLADLLKTLADKRTGGRSSSLPVEEGRKLLLSVTYIIGLNLKRYPSAEEAAEALVNTALVQLYNDGMAEANLRMNRARGIQKRILRNFFKNPNRFWFSTVSDGINGFFKLYSPVFSAREIHITADYPPLAGRPKLCGIEFVERYLRYIDAENAFLLLFPSDKCDGLLRELAKDYADSPVNLFEPILLCALALAHFGREPQRLDLSAKEAETLEAELVSLDLKQTAAFLIDALDKLDAVLKLPKSVGLYIVRCMPILARTVHNNVSIGRSVFPRVSEAFRMGEVNVRDGERLSDAEYRGLRENLLAAQTAGEKLALITENVHSAADIIDIVCDDLLDSAEMNALVEMLPLPAFVLLLKRFPSVEFEEGRNEKQFAEALKARRSSLPPEQSRKLELILENMTVGE